MSISGEFRTINKLHYTDLVVRKICFCNPACVTMHPDSHFVICFLENQIADEHDISSSENMKAMINLLNFSFLASLCSLPGYTERFLVTIP